MFKPVIPVTGLSGWQFLQRTLPAQKEAFAESTAFKRDTEYFRENISKVKTAEDLVGDRRLLSVALGAFGLDDDINSKAFVQQILEGGTNDRSALANRLADSRYAKFSEAFGFGDIGPRTAFSFFADEILTRYENKQFERAVGAQDNSMRLALNLEGEIGDIATTDSTNNTKWFAVMGNSPLRTVFETALGFPSSFGRIDLDQQLDGFKERAQATFGTDKIADFNDPELQEKLVRLYLVREEIANSSGAFSGGSTALTLLQSAPRLF